MNTYDYLSRYTNRTAVGAERLLAIRADKVLLRVRADNRGGDRGGKRGGERGGKRVIAIDDVQFIARLLQHVLPGGFKRIRHYGVLAPAAKAQRLSLARQLLAMPAPDPRATEDAAAFMQRVARIDIERCARTAPRVVGAACRPYWPIVPRWRRSSLRAGDRRDCAACRPGLCSHAAQGPACDALRATAPQCRVRHRSGLRRSRSRAPRHTELAPRTDCKGPRRLRRRLRPCPCSTLKLTLPISVTACAGGSVQRGLSDAGISSRFDTAVAARQINAIRSDARKQKTRLSKSLVFA